MSDLSLIECMEGKLQDKKAMLLAAFRVIVNNRRKPVNTDLHVREFLTYILAMEESEKPSQRRDNQGRVKISYSDLMRSLESNKETVRYVVRRAVEEFQLVEQFENRFASSAQEANSYKICWPVVRYVLARNLGSALPRGGVTESQGGVTESHPTTLTKPFLIPKEETTTTEAPRTARAEASRTTWEVVVVALGECGVSCVPAAIEGAKRLGFDPERCLGLVKIFRELPEENRKPGILFRWLTWARSAPSISAKPKPTAKPAVFDRDREWSKAVSSIRKAFIEKRRRGLTDSEVEEVDRIARIAVDREEAKFFEKHSAAQGTSVAAT